MHSAAWQRQVCVPRERQLLRTVSGEVSLDTGGPTRGTLNLRTGSATLGDCILLVPKHKKDNPNKTPNPAAHPSRALMGTGMCSQEMSLGKRTRRVGKPGSALPGGSRGLQGTDCFFLGTLANLKTQVGLL
jgi:hypothetical protein